MPSITCPSQSMLVPYSQRVPGSNSSGRFDGGPAGGNDRGLALRLGQAAIGFVKEIIAETCRVQHQHPRRDGPLRRTQLRLARGIETVDDLQPPDRGGIGFGRGIKVKKPPLPRIAARAVPVMALVVEKIAKTVSSRRAPSPRRASPQAPE
jgi:hypothetical protein